MMKVTLHKHSTPTYFKQQVSSHIGHTTRSVGKKWNLAKLIQLVVVSERQMTANNTPAHFGFILAAENKNWDTPFFNCKLRPHLNLTPANYTHSKSSLFSAT